LRRNKKAALMKHGFPCVALREALAQRHSTLAIS
jgi:hypothetical protein